MKNLKNLDVMLVYKSKGLFLGNVSIIFSIAFPLELRRLPTASAPLDVHRSIEWDYVHHFVVIPITVEWCLVLRFCCTPVCCQIKCHPFLHLSQSKIELTLIPRWRQHCPRMMLPTL